MKKEVEKKPVDTVVTAPINNKEEIERNFLLMSIAYSANIGGTGVLTGSPPNLVVPDVLTKNFGPGNGLSFATWMAFTCPVMILNVILAWAWLQRLQTLYPGWENSPRSAEKVKQATAIIRKKYADLGRMTMHEAQVLILFIQF